LKSIVIKLNLKIDFAQDPIHDQVG
jgi:hypothetical protein